MRRICRVYGEQSARQPLIQGSSARFPTGGTHVKRLLVAGAIAALGIGGMAQSFAGTDSGQGAQKRGLYVDGGGTNNPCESHTVTPGESPNGFVILNAPGKVGAT